MPCSDGLEKIAREKECEESIKIESAFCAAIIYLEETDQIEEFFSYAKDVCDVDAEEARNIHEKKDVISVVEECKDYLDERQRKLLFDAISSGKIKRKDF